MLPHPWAYLQNFLLHNKKWHVARCGQSGCGPAPARHGGYSLLNACAPPGQRHCCTQVKRILSKDGTMVCWWCCPEIEQSLGEEFAHNIDPLCSVDTKLPLEEPHFPFHHLFACINKHIYCHWHFLPSSPKQLPSMAHTLDKVWQK